jgi:TatD DNase family protein
LRRALKVGSSSDSLGQSPTRDDLRRIAATVPLDRILVETDGPFLTPEPNRGKRNEPAYIPYIVQRLASLANVSDQEMARATTANAAALFARPDE